MRRIFPASGVALAVVAALIWLGQTGCKSYNEQEVHSSLEVVDEHQLDDEGIPAMAES